MSQQLIDSIQKSQLKTDIPDLRVGDTVDVHCRIIEGAKERIQIFNGVIIAIKGGGLTQMVTVRRIVANEGVERIFPVHSPKIAKFDIQRHAGVRRSKLYYLRDRLGKSRRLRDMKRGLAEAAVKEPEATTTATTSAATTPATETTTA